MSSLRSRIDALVPKIRARAEAAERERSVPAETIAELRDAGLFRAFVPKAYGGDELAPQEVLEPIIDLAHGCSSSAWVGSLLAVHNLSVAWLNAEAQDEIFAGGPDLTLASSVAPTGNLSVVDGGFRLSGRWSFSSGVDHAAWIMLGGLLKPKDQRRPPEYFLLYVPMKEAVVHDDWYVAGLRGTGSKSVELADVFVPARRVLSIQQVMEGTAPGLAVHAAPLYRLPWDALFRAAFPPIAIGTAIAMLEGFRNYIGTRVSRLGPLAFKNNAGSLLRLAQSAAQIDAARSLFRRDLASLDCIAKGERVDMGMAERVTYDAVFVVDACTEAVDRLFLGSGGSALNEKNPLQRHFRDVHAMRQHGAFDVEIAGERYAKGLLENPAYALGAAEPVR